jgi:predicted amidohydrolase YtcJ
MRNTLWLNADVVTMDSAKPRAEAFVVEGDRFTYVGDRWKAEAMAGAGAAVVDLGGRTVVPGFNDNHVHALFFGENEYEPDLTGLDADGIVKLLKEWYAGIPAGRLILAHDWDFPSCPEPRKEILDRAFPDNPVVLIQFSGHGSWLNSRALAACGIRKGRPHRGKGVVLRDESGEPTGILRDISDMKLIPGHYIRMVMLRSYREPRLEQALASFARCGITSLQDNTWFFPILFTLARFRRTGRLSARFSCWGFGSMPWTIPLMRLGSYDGKWIRRGPEKYFLDGTFSTRTACLIEDYADEPGKTGMCIEDESIFRIVRSLARRRKQGAFHAIGDGAISSFLDAVEKTAAEIPGIEKLRFRLEHAQLISPEDIERIGRLGILISAQPSTLATPEKDEIILGRERAEHAYPYRSLIDAGVHLSFGSDIPGESSFDPIHSIHMAANRGGPERITAEEALRCYTLGSAYAEFMEGEKGAVAAGQLADFAVLSQDITKVPAARIKDTVVERTVVGGRTVYEIGSSPK